MNKVLPFQEDLYQWRRIKLKKNVKFYFVFYRYNYGKWRGNQLFVSISKDGRRRNWWPATRRGYTFKVRNISNFKLFLIVILRFRRFRALFLFKPQNLLRIKSLPFCLGLEVKKNILEWLGSKDHADPNPSNFSFPPVDAEIMLRPLGRAIDSAKTALLKIFPAFFTNQRITYIWPLKVSSSK